MIASIDYPIRDLLVIDNGGELTSLLSNDFIQNLHVLNMPSNLGVAASWNLGIKLFPHDDKWFFASNDMLYLRGALEKLSEAHRDEITLSDMFPFWHTFCVGESVVKSIGLFDEALYPAYFEDNDYKRRAEHAGLKIRSVSIPTEHENSSTIRSSSEYNEKNGQSFVSNSIYYNDKMARQNYGQGTWSLDRRRRNAWDTPR
jgi:GT2 family glycosyltransferase